MRICEAPWCNDIIDSSNKKKVICSLCRTDMKLRHKTRSRGGKFCDIYRITDSMYITLQDIASDSFSTRAGRMIQSLVNKNLIEEGMGWELTWLGKEALKNANLE